MKEKLSSSSLTYSSGTYTTTGTTITTTAATTLVDPLTGVISLPPGYTLSFPSYITTTPGTSTFPTSDHFVGQIECDYEKKIIKVWNGIDWVEVKMKDGFELTEEEEKLREVIQLEEAIKKEIYG